MGGTVSTARGVAEKKVSTYTILDCVNGSTCTLGCLISEGS